MYAARKIEYGRDFQIATNNFAPSSSLQEFLPVLSHPVEIIRDRSDLAIRKPRLNLRFRGQLNSFALCTRVHRLPGTKFPKPDLCNLLSIPPRSDFVSFHFSIFYSICLYIFKEILKKSWGKFFDDDQLFINIFII